MVDRAPFELEGDDRGVLLIHGFTGTPFEMRFLGDRLHARGMTAHGICLPGHCSSPAELDRTPWTDWYAHVERAFDRLRARCGRVAVVGQSLGGLLSLRLAALRGDDIAALAILAAPLWLTRGPRALIAALHRVPFLAARLRPIRKRGGSDVCDPVAKAQVPSYPVIPLRGLLQLDRARATIRAQLEAVRAPLLLLHATHDHVAPFASMTEIAARVGSPDIKTVTLPRSYHVISIDVERDRVADEVGAFLEARLAGTATAGAGSAAGRSG